MMASASSSVRVQYHGIAVEDMRKESIAHRCYGHTLILRHCRDSCHHRYRLHMHGRASRVLDHRVGPLVGLTIVLQLVGFYTGLTIGPIGCAFRRCDHHAAFGSVSTWS